MSSLLKWLSICIFLYKAVRCRHRFSFGELKERRHIHLSQKASRVVIPVLCGLSAILKVFLSCGYTLQCFLAFAMQLLGFSCCVTSARQNCSSYHICDIDRNNVSQRKNCFKKIRKFIFFSAAFSGLHV